MIVRYTILFTAIICLPALATIINIPDDYPTIQEGIDASTDGDTVLVQPGEYVENINFSGHNIVLGSLFLTTGDTTYIGQTIIDGDSSGSVVTFEDGETASACVTGFTIQNGLFAYGGGIYCLSSNPTISNNIIRKNNALALFAWGGGISCHSSNPTISNNIIRENNASAQFAWGGGISCSNSSPLITDNIISENISDGSEGAGGGGIACLNESNPTITNNLITSNEVFSMFLADGGGIHCDISNPAIINNTITGNAPGGVSGGGSNAIVKNNIIWANAFFEIDSLSSAAITYCDIRGGWEGEGNIDADPLFRDPDNADFHLMSAACGDPNDSPCIDAGSPTIIDSLLDCSWGLGTILSDMGAFGGGDSATVGIFDQPPRIPDRFALLQNYPNPFNAKTIIRYNLPSESDVSIEIFDILGRRVETLVFGIQSAGSHSVIWDATEFPSGIYFARLLTDDYSKSIKIVLLK